MSSLLGTPPSVSLGRMRGQFHRYRGSKVLVTYHPAYLLRNPAAKRDTWEDMQLLMREMGIEIPKRGTKTG
jgi:DNA polymerase